MSYCPHRHGTRHRRASRSCHQPCTCPPCKAAHARYQKQRARARRAGIGFKVPVEEVAAHIEQLERQGMSRDRISILTGIDDRTLRDIVRGRRIGVYRVTAELIYGIDPQDVPLVPAVGTHRRIQALCAVGHTLASIERRQNLPTRSLGRILLQPSVTRTTADRVRVAYEALYAEDGSSSRTAGRAARKGWRPPWMWTDESIDDPKGFPQKPPTVRAHRRGRSVVNPDTVDALCAGQRVPRSTVADRREVVRRLRGLGLHDRQIADRTGFAHETVQRIRTRLGLPPVPRELHQVGAA